MIVNQKKSVIILFFLIITNHFFSQTKTEKRFYILQAELKWKEYNIQKIEVDFLNQINITHEEAEKYFQFQSKNLHDYQHQFFALHENGKIKNRKLNKYYHTILKQLVNDYPGYIKLPKEKTSTITKNAGCTNSDFEDGNLNGWMPYSGVASLNNDPFGLYFSSNRISIMTGNSFDILIGGNILPVVAPGGNYSVRIEDQINNTEASRLSQTFLVTSQNASYTYKYAVVLEDGEHLVNEQAYFKAKVKDQNGKLIDCKYDSLTPTYPYTDLFLQNGFYYRNWTTRTLLLGDYIGQYVTLEFTAQDCVYGGHRGYAYLDGSCMPLQLTASDSVLCSNETSIITAPTGYESYVWSGPGIVQNNNSNSIQINQAGLYEVIVTKDSCSSPIFINILQGDIQSNTEQLCPGDTAILSAPNTFNSYLWSGPGIIGSNNTSTITVNQPGTYSVSVTGNTQFVCSFTYTISSQINPFIGEDITICPGDSVELNVTGGSTHFTWTPNTSMLNSTTSHPTIFPLINTTYIAESCGEKDTINIFVKDSIKGITSGQTINCNANGVPISIAMTTIGNYSYHWTPSNTLNNSNIANPIANPITSTTYHVTVTSPFESNCTYSDSVRIEVPQLTSFYILNNDDAICKGEPIQLNTVYEHSCGVNHEIFSGTLNNIQIGINNNYSNQSSITIFNNITNSSKFQFLITKNELNTLGINTGSLLTQIGFNIYSINGNNLYQNFTIKMGCTSLNALTNTFETNLETVFDSKNVLLVGGVNNFIFDHNFAWLNNTNLIVEISYTNPSTSNNSYIYYNTTNSNLFLYSNNSNNATNGILSTSRPVVYFKYGNLPTLLPITYTWTNANSLNNSTIPNPIASPDSSTTYIVTGTVNLTGCEYIDSVRINVGDIFTINLDDSISNCTSTGKQITLSTNVQDNYSYTWSPNQQINSNTTQNPIVSPMSSQFYYVDVKSSEGCTIKDSIFINVPQTTSFYISNYDDSICKGDSIQLSTVYEHSCGVNHTIFSGTLNNIQIGISNNYSNQSSVTIFNNITNSSKFQFLITKNELNTLGINAESLLTQIGFNIYSIIGTNLYQNFTIKMGCTSLNTLTNTFETNLETVFDPKSVLLIGGVNNFIFDYNFSWLNNTNLIVEISYSNPSISNNSYIYYNTTNSNLFLYSNNSNNATNGILSTSRPVVYFKYGNLPTLLPITYSWTNSGSLNNPTISNPIASPDTITTYIVTGTDITTGCEYKDSIRINVGDIFTINLDDSVVNCNYTGKQISLSTNIQDNYDYAWYPNQYINAVNTQNPVVTPVYSQFYYVDVKSSEGCSIKDSIYINVPELTYFNLESNTSSICTGNNAQFNTIFQKGCGVTGSTTSGTNFQTAQIGSSTNISNNNSITVYKGSNNGSRMQFLITKNELTASGISTPTTLKQIGFKISSIAGTNIYQNFTIKMLCVNQNELTSTSFQNGLQTVFNTKNVLLSVGVNYYNFDQAFNWDGYSDILIEVCYNNNVITSNSTTFFTTTTNNTVLYTTGNQVCSKLAGTLSKDRPNIYFKYKYADFDSNYSITWTPSTGLNNNNIPNPIASPTETTTYYGEIIDDNSGCLFQDSIKIINASSDLNPFFISDTTICAGASITINLGNNITSSILWNDGTTNSSKTISDAGLYWAKISNSCGMYVDTFVVSVDSSLLKLNLDDTIHICNGSSYTYDVQDDNIVNYLWQNGTTNATYTTSSAENIWVEVTSNCGMKSDSSIIIIQNNIPFSLGTDTILCEGNTILLTPNIQYNSYLWQNGSTSSSYIANDEGTYYLTAENECGLFKDTINVNYISLPTIDLGEDTTFCQGETFTLNPSNSNNCIYTWQGNQVASNFTITNTGNYFVEASNQCGSDYDSITVTFINHIPVNLGNDTLLCQDQFLFLDLSNSYTNYSWNNGSNQNSMLISSQGTFILTVSDACGASKDTIIVQFGEHLFPPRIIDTAFCNGDSIVIYTENCENCQFQWNNLGNLSYVYASNPGIYYVDVENECYAKTDTFHVSIKPPPIVNLGPDTSICIGESVTFQVPYNSQNQYLWHNGSTFNSFTTSSVGNYWVQVSNACGSNKDTINLISIHNLPSVEIEGNPYVCLFDTTILSVDDHYKSYKWSNNLQTNSISITNPGTYWIEITDNNSCVSKDTIIITSETLPLYELNNEMSLCNGANYTFELPENDWTFHWPDNSSLNTYTINKPGIYIFDVTNKCGTITDTVNVQEINCNCSIDVPNAFSPNKDGKNDVLYIRGNCDANIDFYVYDRWGEKVFESHNIKNGWDGTYKGELLNGTVFYYYLHASGGSNNINIIKKGNITLVR